MYNRADRRREKSPRGAEELTLATADGRKLSVVFMGSDAFSMPSLDACRAEADVVAVYTQPDRRSGRGRKRLTRSPVKREAVERGLPVEQPERFDKQTCERLRGLGADLIVVAAYGHILPPAALEAARLDRINVHASLLPKHRGAAPVAAAILAGDAVTGVTVIKLRPRLDAGEILCIGRERRKAQRTTPIGEDETAGDVAARLGSLGGEMLADVLRAFADGSVTYESQDEAGATIAPMLAKSDGRIDWTATADQVGRQIRAMTPWPGAHTDLRRPGRESVPLIVLQARPCGDEPPGPPGRVTGAAGGRLLVSTGAGAVELVRLRPAGRNAMSAGEFLRGDAAARRDVEQWIAGP